jgi:hypothetical protein
LWCCRYAREDDRQRRFLRIVGLSWWRIMSLHFSLFKNLKVITGCFTLQILYNFSLILWMVFVFKW